MQTTERTSKQLKLQKLYATLAIIGGATLAVMGFGDHDTANYALLSIGAVVLLAGLIWYIVVRVRTWWHHE